MGINSLIFGHLAGLCSVTWQLEVDRRRRQDKIGALKAETRRQKAMATIVRIHHGFSNSALRMPYAQAILDCGHVASVELKNRRGACHHCGTETDLETGVVKSCCGSSFFRITYSPNPHNAEDRVTKVGDHIDCEQCQREEDAVERLRTLDRKEVHHMRLRHGAYHAYRLDPTSPSGFTLHSSYPCCAKIEAALSELRLSPLSPTERA